MSVRLRVPSPNPNIPEDPRSRVLLIMNISTKVYIDAVMTFL